MNTDRINFSHVHNFTGYMKRITDWFMTKPPGMKILDMPAGAGLMRDALSKRGHMVTCGDINREKEDYIFVDMNKPLPFPDNEFDAVICLEGIEHVIDPVFLIGEIVRVTRKGGSIIVSLPNITNIYSRLYFLFTGIFYQFNPSATPTVQNNDLVDRGHISPLTYWQLRYLFDYFGAEIKFVDGDRYKKKALMPLYLPLILLGRLISKNILLKGGEKAKPESKEIYSHMFSAPALFSRSLILYMEKTV